MVQIDPVNEINTMKNPSNLKEILAAAAPMFKDKAVVSVIIEATFGMVEVYRSGAIFHVGSED
jgi:hypothetical protein